jgi:hypothetical protein
MPAPPIPLPRFPATPQSFYERGIDADKDQTGRKVYLGRYRMTPKSCKLFGQDHASKQKLRAKWASI